MEGLRARLGHLSAAWLRVCVYCEDFLLPKVHRTMVHLWSVYSKPVPANARELWTLFLQCFCITVVIGGLFYNWMFASLEYSRHLSTAIAVSFSLLLLLTLFLVHPARCVFSIIMPTLGLKLSREEVMLCLAQMMFLTVVLMLMLVIIVMDHFAFSVADTAVRKVAQFSVVPVTLSIKYSAKIRTLPFLWKLFQISYGEPSIQDFEKSYHHYLSFSSAHCRISPPRPSNNAVVLIVGLLYFIIYTTVFLETYAHRSCRKIAASFFESQEEKRAHYLYNKLSRKYEEEKNSTRN
ncbi:osteoclast stimulatory transmembrane protein isoform X2 [Apteryx mantelli]|uniref:Osteoclast stimulatory transmembrane protein isoform X2 n=1 Tax=Apteryx mantelli TaxID=2696672 RepID=A0ABM4FG98_9AVES